MDEFYDFKEKNYYESLRKCHSLLQLKILELACAKFVWKGRNTYTFNRCFLILQGEGSLTNHTGGQEFTMLPGYAYFMPPETDLSLDFRPGLELLSIHFHAFLLPGIDCFSEETQCLEFRMEMEQLKIFQRLLESRITWNTLCRFESLLWDLFSRISPEGLPGMEVVLNLQSRYGKLLLYIHNNISARTGIDELCSFSGMSRDTLSRHFSRDFGLPLKLFLMKELLSVAERYLLWSDLTIREIGLELKFSSEFYFSSFFKRMKGVSPSMFRQEADRHKRSLFSGDSFRRRREEK